ncbi:putative secreted RxLR effector peptide protein [Phytophthora cinnamomi]|uniref:putative secreted RxLR effector peptide protein n=1 Tax=Phytophthora cinnamomi TaxID=4785 RepID=UPI002A2B2F92|nr:putative secreted RxLR effector peptide protein [Phytophthora cinnamomi]KAJ8574543.1 hypothetical protein ON010_g4673 [Phytophthora cinnamomi]
MRRECLVLVLLLVGTFTGRSDAVSRLTVPEAASVTDSNHAPITRNVRDEGVSTDVLAARTTLSDEERDISQVASFVSSSMKAKAKLSIMLIRGYAPEKALQKLSVTSINGKNFNSFARYYARYLTMHPEKAASLPATAEDVVVLPKLTEWLGQKLLPSQVKQLLKEFGSTNVNKYLQLYRKDADDVLALPKLSEWVQQQRPPSQVNMLLKDLEITDVSKYMGKYMEAGAATTAFKKWTNQKLLPKEVAQKLKNAEVPDVSKYMGQYMDSGGANIAFQNWLENKILPQQLALKLKIAEVPDISKYMGQYMEAGGAKLAFEKWLGLREVPLPQQVKFRLQSAEVPDINKYLKQYVSLWGERQARLSRDMN